MLKEELIKRVSWFIENPIKVEQYISLDIECHVNGVNLSSKTPVIFFYILREQEQIRHLDFEVDFHSSTQRFIQRVQFQAGIIASEPTAMISTQKNRSDLRYESHILPETGRTLFMMDNDFDILPGSWSKAFFSCVGTPVSEGWKLGKKYEFTIRIFMESGPTDFPFTVKIEDRLD